MGQANPAKGLKALGMSSTYQRALIRTLLNRRDIPTDYITIMHRDIFNGIKNAREGRPVNDLLLELSMVQAGDVIRKLQG